MKIYIVFYFVASILTSPLEQREAVERQINAVNVQTGIRIIGRFRYLASNPCPGSTDLLASHDSEFLCFNKATRRDRRRNRLVLAPMVRIASNLYSAYGRSSTCGGLSMVCADRVPIWNEDISLRLLDYVLLHELGHLFGARDGKAGVMEQMMTWNLTFQPTDKARMRRCAKKMM